jgi:hypothetical protein
MKQIKIIVICNDGIPNQEIVTEFKKKLDEFHENNLLLFGKNIEVIVFDEKTNFFKKVFKLLKTRLNRFFY